MDTYMILFTKFILYNVLRYINYCMLISAGGLIPDYILYKCDILTIWEI